MNQRPIILAFLLLGCSPSLIHDSGVANGQSDVVLDSTARSGFQEALHNLTSPELEHRKKTRRLYQQRHYADILYELVALDAPGALLAAARSRMQLELQLPNRPLTMTVPIAQPSPRPGTPPSTATPSEPWVITLYENRAFPTDPWSHP